MLSKVSKIFNFRNPRCFTLISNNLLAVASSLIIIIYDLNNQKSENTIKAHESLIYSLLKPKKKNIFLSSSEDKTIKVWSISNYSNVHIFSDHTNSIISLNQSSINEDEIISCSADTTIHFYNLSTFHCVKIFKDTTKVFFALDITQTAQLISIGFTSNIKIWDIKTQMQTHILKGHDSLVYCFRYINKFNYIISVSEDKTVKFWNLTNYECIFTSTLYEHCLNYIINLIENYCAISDNEGYIIIINIETKQIISTIKTEDNMSIYSLQFYEKKIYYNTNKGVYMINTN